MSDATVTGPRSSSDGSSTPAKTGPKAGRQGARPLADVKEIGGQLVNAARNGANSLYEEQRNRAADEISALGDSLQRSAKSLDGTIGESIAPYAETAARQVEEFAGTLRQRSLSQVGDDIEGVARQWPMAFLAAAVGAGFIAGRFLLSSGNPIDVVAGNKAKPAEGDTSAAAPATRLDAPGNGAGLGGKAAGGAQ